MATNKKATPTEVNGAMELSQVLLALAISKDPHVGMTGLIMATAVGAASLGIPLENICALFDKTVSDVYAVKAKQSVN
ncbi:hypothetical protein UFOVP149_5 [uncultured Caudovirales phage]|uniref:Uncharacterized protein n=1 Tax=uncultured Caudovirales phage TaxID=2100421 RepID=A0A6J7W6I4_9CAUD|nr:hypothetical protein UFOVP149_5 [uncultured Caudovirales phage]